MRFDLDDEQRAIKQAVHDLCAARYDAAGANRRESSRPDEFWPELSASGWTQLSVPERWGGQGAGLLELSLVIEELGYSLVPATFFGNAAAGLLVAASQRDELRDRWLPGIASGEHRAAFGQVQRDGGALALDAEGALTTGINVPLMRTLTFVLGGLVGGLAGVLVGPLVTVYFDMGLLLTLKGFAAAILGGLANPMGAIVGGVTLGLLESLAIVTVSSGYKDVIAMAILIVIMIAMPNGLLGRRLRKGG